MSFPSVDSPYRTSSASTTYMHPPLSASIVLRDQARRLEATISEGCLDVRANKPRKKRGKVFTQEVILKRTEEVR